MQHTVSFNPKRQPYETGKLKKLSVFFLLYIHVYELQADF